MLPVKPEILFIESYIICEGVIWPIWSEPPQCNEFPFCNITDSIMDLAPTRLPTIELVFVDKSNISTDASGLSTGLAGEPVRAIPP